MSFLNTTLLFPPPIVRPSAGWDPNFNPPHSLVFSLTNNNITANYQGLSTGIYVIGLCTLGKSSGKWYWEYLYTGTLIDAFTGVANHSVTLSGNYLGLDGNGWGYDSTNGFSWHGGTPLSYGATWGTGDVMGVALDMDNGFMYVSKNNVWQHSSDPTSGILGTGAMYGSLTGTLYPAWSCGPENVLVTANFGGSAFVGTVPSGYNPGIY